MLESVVKTGGHLKAWMKAILANRKSKKRLAHWQEIQAFISYE
jgi:hypothetical protein